MAEKQVAETGGVAANRPSAVEIPEDSVEYVIRQAPEPTSEGGKVYRVKYPTDLFVMEGMPVVTSTGTPLTEEQAEKLLPVAEESGVLIVEVTE